jgi:sugar lactone lactonase YvrE
LRACSGSLSVLAMLILTLLFTGCEKDEAQPSDESGNYLVTTIAGNGTNPLLIDPRAIAIDAQGDLYVADAGSFSIRKITSAGTITTLAGGEQGYEDGEGSAAQFFSPGGVAVGMDGNIYVTDGTRVRKITASGIVTTLAGSLTPGLTDGNGADALFNSLSAIAVDKQGTVYVMDNVLYETDGPNPGSRIRKISPTQDVTTFHINSFALHGLALDSHGNIYVTEDGLFWESNILKITPGKEITKFAAIPSSSLIAVGLQDVIYITAYTTDYDYDYEKVYRIVDGKYISIAGGKPGFADGVGNTAQFNSLKGLATDASGNIYLADLGNNRIRKITKK